MHDRAMKPSHPPSAIPTRSHKEQAIAERLDRIREIVEHFRSLPTVGPPLTDEDLYDEDGMPR
jgi:hypothetical protein